MQERFAARPSAGPCLCCGEPASTDQWVYWWRATTRVRLGYPAASVLWLLVGVFRPRVEQQVLPFCTVHSFCRRCGKVARWRRVGAFCVKLVSDLVLIGSVLTALLAAMGGLANPTRKDGWLLVYGVAIATFCLGLIGRRWAFRIQVPTPLQFIRRWPFYFQKATPLSRVHLLHRSETAGH